MNDEHTAPPVGGKDLRFWVPFGVVIGFFVYLVVIQGYATGYEFTRTSLGGWMWEHWTDGQSDWEFGMMVLPVALVVAWLTRDQYRHLKVEPSIALGGALLVVALLFYFAGYKANERYFGYFGMQVFIAGAVVWFLGFQWLKQGIWLWCLLGAMWPWLFLEGALTSQLQLIMVKMTAAFLNLIGDPAVTNGTAIVSQGTETLEPGDRFQLNIAAGCSGIRSLFALGMIGLVYANLAVKEHWKRFVLVLTVPAIAVLGNFVRMVILYIGTITLGPEVAIGTGVGQESGFHIGSGLVVFVVALICLTGVVKLLNHGLKAFSRKKVVTKMVGDEKGGTE